MFTRTTSLIICFSALMVGCGLTHEALDEQQEIISNLLQAGYPDSEIMVVGDRVYVGRDAHVTLEASREMIRDPGPGEEQYRTTNLISLGTTKICINPTSTFNSYSRLSEGLDLAIGNYNALPLVFDFVRGSTTGCSAYITPQTTSGVGGSAGFPSGGLPYGAIDIGTGLQSYSIDVNEHVITHEIGHTIGLRHSDYYNRSISCGSGGNEGDAGVGAIFIPGTPSTATVGGSIMNSCFRSTETGEFSSSDITALTYLYSPPPPQPPLVVGIEGSSCVAQIPAFHTWFAEVSGGTGSYSYQWSSSVATGTIGTRASVTLKYKPGFTLYLTVTSGGQTASSSMYVEECTADPCALVGDGSTPPGASALQCSL